jgi:hypothetical protein
VSREMHTLYMTFPIEHSESSIGCQSYIKLVMDRNLFPRIIFYWGSYYDLLRKFTSRYIRKGKRLKVLLPLRLNTRQPQYIGKWKKNITF